MSSFYSINTGKNNGEEAGGGEAGGGERKCPNPPLAPLNHKVMSKAEKRRAAKNIQPPTREERETARENLQELRKKMRHLKSHGWRGKVRRGEINDEKRMRDDGFTSVTQDGGFEDAQEEKVLREKMGQSNSKTTTKGAASAIPTKSVAVASTRNKKHRAEEDGDVW